MIRINIIITLYTIFHITKHYLQSFFNLYKLIHSLISNVKSKGFVLLLLETSYTFKLVIDHKVFLFLGGVGRFNVEKDKLRAAGVAVLLLANAWERLLSLCLTVLFI